MEIAFDIRDLRQMYLRFFAARGHAVIPAASLLPDNDPSVLFTTAGMHPLLPYLAGQAHPAGRRLVNCQQCVRTNDIEAVGDGTHLTCFEMLGNWSIGDYGKRQSIEWSFEFLNSPAQLGIAVDRLWVTVFEGNSVAPRDEEAAGIWRGLGLPDRQIVFLGEEHNWWSAGPEGPCGPDTEIFYDRTGQACAQAERCQPGVCGCPRFVEIWNNVFMSFVRQQGRLSPLPQQNIDTGMGLERMVSVLAGLPSVYDVGGLREIGERLREHCGVSSEEITSEPKLLRAMRILVDHLRASVFILADPRGPEPCNQGAGYVLRRLIRRAVRSCDVLKLEPSNWVRTADLVVELYGLEPQLSHVRQALDDECERFRQVRQRGERMLLREVQRAKRQGSSTVGSPVAFTLYDTYGFPIEFTEEIAREHGLTVDRSGFDALFREHQQRSKCQAGLGRRAASGLADDSQQSVRYHTATHLLHAALREILGSHVEQKGSNITSERLRFDFSHPRPLTEEQRHRVQHWVQQCIDAALPVSHRVTSLNQARNEGAIGLFADRYDGDVSLYQVGDRSLEVCAGPHVANTGELGRFEIVKEQSSGSGIRRIRAVLAG